MHREVCRKYLPPAILARKKRGFAVNVVDEWFHSSLEGVLPEMLLDRDSLIFGLLEPKAVRRLLDEHRSKRQDNHKLLFSLVMFEQWLRESRSPPASTGVTRRRNNAVPALGSRGRSRALTLRQS